MLNLFSHLEQLSVQYTLSASVIGNWHLGKSLHYLNHGINISMTKHYI